MEAAKQPLCFVIGPIGKDLSQERKHADLLLHAVIKHVLEAEEFGYKVKRADEDADPGMISDRVISDIIHAELVVADLAELNPNAFYELGIRHSTEKPTIHTARSNTPLPFDNVAHRTIFIDLADWQSIQRGRAQLAASARAIQDPGFQVSNPITQANASFKMRESADPLDRVITEIKERVARLEIRLPALTQNRVEDEPRLGHLSIPAVGSYVIGTLAKGIPEEETAELANIFAKKLNPDLEVRYLSEGLGGRSFSLFRGGEKIHTYRFQY